MNDTEARVPGAISPQEDLEMTLEEVWQGLFGRANIGRDDNFFELGGDSVLGMQLLESLDARCAVQLPLVTVFQAPTIRELARAVSEAKQV